MIFNALMHPQIDPIAIRFPQWLQNYLPTEGIAWYGLMYVFAFAAFLLLGRYRAKKPHSPITPNRVDDIMFYGAIGVILGGRLGYMLFYNLDALLATPSLFFKTWEGGMSFHGGLIGVIFAIWLLSKKWKKSFLEIGDFIAPLIPLGLGFGRIGNFIGQELVGRSTDAPWGMIFPKIDNIARHPSQLYQAVIEGVIIFLIVWFTSRKKREAGTISGLFFMLYSIGRFIVEFFRMPDSHIGFDAFDWLTRGQLLSIPMFIIGLLLFLYGCKLSKKTN